MNRFSTYKKLIFHTIYHKNKITVAYRQNISQRNALLQDEPNKCKKIYKYTLKSFAVSDALEKYE